MADINIEEYGHDQPKTTIRIAKNPDGDWRWWTSEEEIPKNCSDVRIAPEKIASIARDILAADQRGNIPDHLARNMRSALKALQ